MDREALRQLMQTRLNAHARRLGAGDVTLHDGLDLIRSGLVDSLGFVDLLTELEAAAGRQVDLERTLGRPGATTVRGVLDLFERA